MSDQPTVCGAYDFMNPTPQDVANQIAQQIAALQTQLAKFQSENIALGTDTIVTSTGTDTIAISTSTAAIDTIILSTSLNGADTITL